jgi:hypothetical protein
MVHRKEIGGNSNVTTIVIKNIKMYDHLTNWFNTIQLWFFKSKFRSYIGEHFFIRITTCMPLKFENVTISSGEIL